MLFFKFQNFKLKLLSTLLSTEFGLCDKKITGFILTPNTAVGKSFLLISSHKGFIEILQTHFNKLWNEAEEYKLEHKSN